MVLIIPVLLLLVDVPSPTKTGEICVVDTELLAVGAAFNWLHIWIRMTPTHPVCVCVYLIFVNFYVRAKFVVPIFTPKLT